MYSVYAAMKRGMAQSEIHDLTFIDPWFLAQLGELLETERCMESLKLINLAKDDLYEIKRKGYSDKQIAYATGSTEKEVRAHRKALGVIPAYKRVDTCAAEFEAHTPYLYSSYDDECESVPNNLKKVLILGGGPNRIGQGIEFDYCCCHAAFALEVQSNDHQSVIANFVSLLGP
jgi:carbamoyl-phosphate synthase large subunit